MSAPPTCDVDGAVIKGFRDLVKHGFGWNPPTNAFESCLDPLAIFLRVRDIDVPAVAFPIVDASLAILIFHVPPRGINKFAPYGFETVRSFR